MANQRPEKDKEFIRAIQLVGKSLPGRHRPNGNEDEGEGSDQRRTRQHTITASSRREATALHKIAQEGGPVPVEDSSSSSRHSSTEDASWVVREPIIGSLSDDLIIPNFLGHVASRYPITRDSLKLQNRVAVTQRFRQIYDQFPLRVRDLLDSTSLAHLRDCVFTHLNTTLISAFVERWQSDTNTFQLPFGEMTITLDDV